MLSWHLTLATHSPLALYRTLSSFGKVVFHRQGGLPSVVGKAVFRRYGGLPATMWTGGECGDGGEGGVGGEGGEGGER
jgi:hypothetical protein